MPHGRVTVHFASGHADLVAEVLHDAVQAGGVASGITDARGLERLRAAGLVVEPVPAPDGEARAGPPPRPSFLARALAFADSVRGWPSEPSEPTEPNVLLVVLEGPLFPQWRGRLEELGAYVLERRAPRTWTLVTHLQTDAVAEIDFVASVRPYTVFDTLHPAQLGLTDERPASLVFEAIVHPGFDAGEAAARIAAQDLEIVAVTSRSVRFRADVSGPALPAVARLPDVATVADFREPTAANDHARALAGVEPPAASNAHVLPWTGAGQVVGIADSGVDDTHADLAGRFKHIDARGRPGDHSDPTGHGTHVTGTLAGSGAASHGAYKGMAPDAELVFQSIMDTGGGWSGIGASIQHLLDDAYLDDVRIHNDSWTVEGNGSAYPAYSVELDEYVYSHPDLLVVAAAGNSGSAAHPVNSPVGWVDLMSIGAPGTAKNALTVGACRSDRAPVGPPPQTFGAQDGAAFPAPPVRDYPVSGDAQGLAAFSSRGPCDDQHRVKPDLVAPGTSILSARASNATGPFWAAGPSPEYAYDGGTSMAAPVVAGAAALVREYLVKERKHEPSAALLKAILVNGAQRLTGLDALAAPAGEPNFHQGFGALSLRTSVPHADEPDLVLHFHDDWSGSDALADTGSGFRFDVSADAGFPLRICVAWTDPPGRSVQNCISLRVQHVGSPAEWTGNQDRPQYLQATLDQTNNVQVVRIPDPLAGDYELWVEATSLTVPDQPFALAVTGKLASPLVIGQHY
jgi:serine protease AprX